MEFYVLAARRDRTEPGAARRAGAEGVGGLARRGVSSHVLPCYFGTAYADRSSETPNNPVITEEFGIASLCATSRACRQNCVITTD